MTEEEFRALLDHRGILVPGALDTPYREACFSVFAQRTDLHLDAAALKHQASTFFDAKLGLTVDKRYDVESPALDAARVVLVCDDGSAAGTRLVFGRPVAPDDLVAAAEAERRAGTFGLTELAHRCRILWLVVPDATDDRVALTLAAIFASTMLGPILSPDAESLFGVRTARLKLESRARPYR